MRAFQTDYEEFKYLVKGSSIGFLYSETYVYLLSIIVFLVHVEDFHLLPLATLYLNR